MVVLELFVKKTNLTKDFKNIIKILQNEKIFYKNLINKISKLNNHIFNLGLNIKKIISKEKFIGYGCPAKAMTFIYNINLPYENMPYIIDDNELKQNKYIPGYNIKVINKKHINKNSFKYVLIFSWNVYSDILNNNKSFFKNKTIIIPLPILRIINC